MQTLLYLVQIDESFTADYKTQVQFIHDHLDLDLFEKTRLAAIRNESDVRLACVSYLLSRWGISQLTNHPLTQIKINRAGSYLSEKPTYLGPTSRRKIDFNISHDKECCVGIFSNHYTVGIDVMHLDPRSNHRNLPSFFKSMRRIFSDQEWNYVFKPVSEIDDLHITVIDPNSNSQDLVEQRSSIRLKDLNSQGGIQMIRFLFLWTTKEAFSKCLGMGLSLDPIEIAVEVGRDGVVKVRNTSRVESVSAAAPMLFRLFSLPSLNYLIVTCQIMDKHVYGADAAGVSGDSQLAVKQHADFSSSSHKYVGTVASRLFDDAWNNIVDSCS